MTLVTVSHASRELSSSFIPSATLHCTSLPLKIMLRVALRPASLAARAVRPATRALSGSAIRRAVDHHDHDHEPQLQPALIAPGAPAGTVPTDDVHATGVERLQVLGEMYGVKVFDYEPLDSSRIGTKKDPIKVFSWVRIICMLLSVASLK